MAHQLLEIVHDLVRDRGRRAQFNQDPEAFMTRYGLSAEARTALYTMDPEAIGLALGKELAGFQFEPGEFPACDWGESEQEVELLYPQPTPRTFGIEPKRAAASDGLEVTIWGQSFPEDATVVFDPPLATNGQRRAGTYRCGRISVTLRSPAAGVHTVVVRSARIGKTIGSNQPVQLTLT